MVGESGEDGRKELAKTVTLNQTRDKLKHSKHTRLHGDELSITITLSTPPFLTVHYRSDIPYSRSSGDTSEGVRE